MDKEKLKQVLVDLRDVYKEEWKKVKNDIFQHFKEIREIVKSNEEIDFETAKKIHEKIEAANNLTKPFLLWFWPSPYGKSTEDIENIRTEILNNPESRKTLIEAEKLQHLSDIDKRPNRGGLKRCQRCQNCNIQFLALHIQSRIVHAYMGQYG